MKWIKLYKLPQHASFISSNFGEFWYRENSLTNSWQVITEDNTLYPGRWPDVVCNSIEEAMSSAEDHFAWNLIWIAEEDEEIKHDRVHKDIGNARPARVHRRMKNNS